MISKFGYEGGDSEEALIAALKQDFTSETTDALEKVRTKYMRDGHIIAIAVARGYTKKLGFKGWLALKVGCGETHARNCTNCWKLRHDFDRVADWWRSGNTEFQPSKLSGPVLYLELHKAWKERGLSDAEKLAKRGKKKGLGNKQLRELLALHRNWLDRLASEHMKWAETDARESRVLSQIIRERAEAEGNKDDVAFPLKSTYAPSPEEPDETDDDGKRPQEKPTAEQHLEGGHDIAEQEQHLGGDEWIAAQAVPPVAENMPAQDAPLEQAGVALVAVTPPKRKGGWPKGKKRKPSRGSTKAEAAQ